MQIIVNLDHYPHYAHTAFLRARGGRDKNTVLFVVARGTNDAASFRVKIMAQSRLSLILRLNMRDSARGTDAQRVRACAYVTRDAQTYRITRRATPIISFEWQRACTRNRLARTSAIRQTPRVHDWHPDDTLHCVVYENRIAGNNAV